MFSRFNKSAKRLKALFAACAMSFLAACDGGFGPIGDGGPLLTRGAVQVALLVPYGSATPGDEILARSLENAARLANSDLGGQSLEITVYPTAGSASSAALATDRAIEEGAQIILGPLRSDAANAAAVAARDDGVNVLAFSNNASIAGGNLFILGTTFENIANRVLGYSRASGRNRVVVVHPRTAVGEIAKGSVTRAAARMGVEVVGDGSFEFSQEGIASAIPGIAQTVQESGATAIMLTDDSSGALPILAQLLPQGGVRPESVKYLGLSRWDIPPQTMSYPALQGGWFALPDPGLTGQFVARYQGTYGTDPHPLAGLAYDGIAAIGALVADKRNLSAGNLTQPSGFRGVNGVFRFQQNGTVERALAIAQVTNTQVQIIDPAPRSFGAGG